MTMQLRDPICECRQQQDCYHSRCQVVRRLRFGKVLLLNWANHVTLFNLEEVKPYDLRNTYTTQRPRALD